jgi:hypothetical protein
MYRDVHCISLGWVGYVAFSEKELGLNLFGKRPLRRHGADWRIILKMNYI